MNRGRIPLQSANAIVFAIANERNFSRKWWRGNDVLIIHDHMTVMSLSVRAFRHPQWQLVPTPTQKLSPPLHEHCDHPEEETNWNA